MKRVREAPSAGWHRTEGEGEFDPRDDTTRAAIGLLLARLGSGVKRRGPGWVAPCPAHEDRNPSLSIKVGEDGRALVHCFAGCTPEAIVEALGLRMSDLFQDQDYSGACNWRAPTPRTRIQQLGDPGIVFTAQLAQITWSRAHRRARDDDQIENCWAVYDFLARRQLADADEYGAYGILEPVEDRTSPLWNLWRTSHFLIVPLYDSMTSELVSVQGRAVSGNSKDAPKVLTPRGGRVTGTVFADARALSVLAGTWTGPRRLLWCEGLTDHLGATFSSPVPCVSSPGASSAEKSVGRWVAGLEVFVATDLDLAGHDAAVQIARGVEEHGGTPLRLVWPRGCKDLCDTLRALGPRGLCEYLDARLGGSSNER